MRNRIWLSSPHMSGDEIKYVNEAFETNWIAPLGPNVNSFENELANYLNVSHVAALSSGTGAMHLALIVLGIKSGDEVICQSFTFSATVNPVLYQGAIPIFIDSEKDTWNMDPELLEYAIKDRISKGKKPKAIIVVHLYGMPAKMNEIIDIANHYEIPLIEDAAEALGSRYNNTMVGSFGELSILSFNGNKIITTSGGGALISKNEEYIKQAKFYATQSRDVAPYYQHTKIGYNYRMSNVLAGIGRGQLQNIESRVKSRRDIFKTYFHSLNSIEGITFLQEPSFSFSNRWLTTILLDEDKTGGISNYDMMGLLESENVESRLLWKPMHMQPVFQGYPAYINGISEELFKFGLCLPSGSNMSREDISFVIDLVIKTLNNK